MTERRYLPRPLKARPAVRRGFVAALVVSLMSFAVVDAYAQVTGSGGFVIMRATDGTNVINVGDNANSALRVNVVAGSGGGVTHVDDAAFTVATDDGVPMFAMLDNTTPDSVDENDAGIVRMSANRNLFTTLRDAAGNERGANINASNELTVTASQSGTWTVQPGNTANTTAWLMKLSQTTTDNDVDVTTLPSASAANNDGAQVSVTTTSGTVLASFSTRKWAVICASPTNTDIVHLKLGATATTSDYKLHIGQCFNIGPVPYTGVVDARSAAGTQEVSVMEW